MSKTKGKYCCECEFWKMIGSGIPPEFVHEGECTVPCDRDETLYREALATPCDRWVRRKFAKVSYPCNGQFRYLCYMCKHWIHALEWGMDLKSGFCDLEKRGLVGAYEQACCKFARRGNGKRR